MERDAEFDFTGLLLRTHSRASSCHPSPRETLMKVALSTPRSRSLVLAGMAVSFFGLYGQAAFSGPTVTAKALEGVWKVTKVAKLGSDAASDTHPQPSLAIYSRGYFTILRDNSSEPRKPAPLAKDPAKPTDAEKLAKYEEWAPYSASGGTYEVKGDRIITHNVVAKQAGGTTATEEAIIVKFSNNTLVVRPLATPAGPPGEAVERTYTRVR
jgi:hypothetical protein